MTTLSSESSDLSTEELTETPVKSNFQGILRTSSSIKEMPFQKATGLSMALHVITPALLVGVAFVILLLLAWLLNIDWRKWFAHEEPKPDVEFALVKDTQAPPPKTAHFKGEFNQQAGGKPDPNKTPTPTDNNTQSAEQASQPPSPPQKAAPQQQKSTQAPQQTVAQKPAPQAQPKPPTPPVKQPTKQPDVPAPKFNPTIPVPKAADASKMPAPKTPQPQGPIATSTNASPNTQRMTPGPVNIPNNNNLSSASPARNASPSNTAGGIKGVAQGGPNSQAGVDVAQDWQGPYMAELTRRIRRNWHPPRDEHSKRVVVVFNIARDGRLLKWTIKTSGGDPNADEAAIEALKLSAPFRALPPQLSGESLPIEFTFDYNVFGQSGNRTVTR